MVTLFRKILIRTGKIIPFVFAFVVALSYIESIYAVSNEIMVADTDGGYVYYLPIRNYIGNIVYIDWFDVLLRSAYIKTPVFSKLLPLSYTPKRRTY